MGKKRVIALFVLPMIVLFSACSADVAAGSKENDSSEVAGEELRSVSSGYAVSSAYRPAETPGIRMDAEPVLPQEHGMTDIVIGIGTQTYEGKLYDNEAAHAFAALLPLTLDMAELGGNEKYTNLDTDFPINQEQVGAIQKGELMLYGGNCVVLFYESFSTSYRYTRLGYLDDPSGLQEVLGSGSVTIEFKRQQ